MHAEASTSRSSTCDGLSESDIRFSALTRCNAVLHQVLWAATCSTTKLQLAMGLGNAGSEQRRSDACVHFLLGFLFELRAVCAGERSVVAAPRSEGSFRSSAQALQERRVERTVNMDGGAAGYFAPAATRSAAQITRLRFRVRIFRRRSAFIFSFLLFGIVRVSDRQTLHGIGGHAYRIFEYV
jgi:hypothetical protein